jgi:O-antigen ligase
VRDRVLDWMLLGTLAVMSLDKIRWEAPAFTMTLSNITSVIFVVAFAYTRWRTRDAALPPAAITLCAFFLAFMLVILGGYWNLADKASLHLWLKGIGTWGVHFLLLICALAHIVRRGAPLYVRAVRWFLAGIAANAVYGIVQLVLQVGAGINLDKVLVGPLTAGQGGVGGLNIYGKVGSGSVYRVNALTGDPNHLGVILCIPLLALLPLVVVAPRSRAKLAILLGFLFAVQTLTLSRSAALGDLVGLLVLSPVLLPALRPYARRILIGITAVAATCAVVYTTVPFVNTVVRSRTQVSGQGSQTHLEFYRLVPPALNPHPVLGMGFNTFATFYQKITGRSDYGPHSVWVAVLVETGLLGFGVYLVYFAYIVLCAAAMRASPERDAALFGWGLLAALAGTAVANLFYLTMRFDYFFAVALIAIAGPIVYGAARRRASVTTPAPAPAPGR